MSLQRCVLAAVAGSALGLICAPQAADAAGVDATVSHRALSDGPVELELYGGKVVQSNPPAATIHGNGEIRLQANNISKPTEISCQIRKSGAPHSGTTPVRVVEHLRQGEALFSTDKVITLSVGKSAPLTFIAVPEAKGSYVYSITSVDEVPLHFVDCSVRTLGGDEPSKLRRSAARRSPRAGRAATPASRASGGGVPRISGTRSLKRLSRTAARTFDRAKAPARQTRQPKPPTPATSHTFGALKFVSESKQARIYSVSGFGALTTQGLRILANASVTTGITVPSGKSAIVDCAVEVASKNGKGVTMSVKQSGGALQTHALDDGAQHLVFGIGYVVGLETITIKSVSSPFDTWTLGQCEVSFK